MAPKKKIGRRFLPFLSAAPPSARGLSRPPLRLPDMFVDTHAPSPTFRPPPATQATMSKSGAGFLPDVKPAAAVLANWQTVPEAAREQFVANARLLQSAVTSVVSAPTPRRPSPKPDWCDYAKGQTVPATASSGPVPVTILTPKGKKAPQYAVATNRHAKAARLLSPDALAKALTSPCNHVQDPCKSRVTLADVARVRQWLLQAPTEAAATARLGDWMQLCLHEHGGPSTYTLPAVDALGLRGIPAGAIPLCRTGLIAVLGISEAKFRRARNVAIQMRASAAKSGMPVPVPTIEHGNQGKRYTPKADKSVTCRTFWDMFYGMICNVISDECRSVPSGQVKKQVYEDVFIPWYTNSDRALEDMPKWTTFLTASRHVDFSDVKKRAKHYHTRCAKCATLQSQRALCFTRGSPDQLKYKAASKAHVDEVRQFRELESFVYERARHSPDTYIAICCDDTEALRLPHFTNRERKDAAGIYRYDLVPYLFENSATGELGYILSPKVNHAKGANRWCTNMYCMFRALKSGTGPAAAARTVDLVSDNYCEQKCNTDLHLATQFVAEGWFDVINFYYGSVGHTHTSIDARHKIFNQDVKRGNIGHLGDLPSLVRQKFATRPPDLFLMDLQLDFNATFTHSMERIAGFTNAGKDRCTANAFRIAREDAAKGGKIGLWWKPIAGRSTPWLGQDGTPSGSPFYLMRHRTVTCPKVIPARPPMPKKQQQSLFGPSMSRCLEEEQMHGVMDWVKRAVTEQKFPIANEIETSYMPGRLGRLVEVGVLQNVGRYRLIDQTWLRPFLGTDDMDAVDKFKLFWSLPKKTIDDMARARAEAAASMYAVGLADVRYERAPDTVIAESAPDAASQLAIPVPFDEQPAADAAPPGPGQQPKGVGKKSRKPKANKAKAKAKPSQAKLNQAKVKAKAKPGQAKPSQAKAKAIVKAKAKAKAKAPPAKGDESGEHQHGGSKRLQHAKTPDYRDVASGDDMPGGDEDIFGPVTDSETEWEPAAEEGASSDEGEDAFGGSGDVDVDLHAELVDLTQGMPRVQPTIKRKATTLPNDQHPKRRRAVSTIGTNGRHNRVMAPAPDPRAPAAAAATTKDRARASVNLDEDDVGLWVDDDEQTGGYVVSTAEYPNGLVGLSISIVHGTSNPDDDDSLQTSEVPSSGLTNRADPKCLAAKWLPGLTKIMYLPATTPGNSIITRFTRFRHDGRLHPGVVNWIKRTDTYQTMVKQARQNNYPHQDDSSDSDNEPLSARKNRLARH